MIENNNSIGGTPSPLFYPSVSGVSKNVWSVMDHIELLVSYDYPQFLVSCFDIYKEQNNNRMKKNLYRASEQNQLILWDSGVYEMVWSRSKRWSKKRYIKTLKRNNVTHAFAFDDYFLERKKIDGEVISKTVRSTERQVSKTSIYPIIHSKNTSDYPELCFKVSKACSSKMIAIPERELGNGVYEIVENIIKIKKFLNGQKIRSQLHVLGTGNPISMMLYAIAGADSFDGLDWCQTVVDYETATLHHPLQLDFFKDQSEWGNVSDVSFFTRCYLHNLEFYKIWMEKLQKSLIDKTVDDMLQEYLSMATFDSIKQILVK